MTSATRRTLVALLLQLSALAALSAAWLGLPWIDSRSAPRVLVLVDRSDSLPRRAGDEALARVVQALRGGPAQVLTIEFAGQPAPAGTPQAPGSATAALEPASTNIESALHAALAVHARSPLAGVVVVSDGHASAGDTERGLRALRAAAVPLHWHAVGREAPPVRIAELLAPAQAAAGQPLQIRLRLAGASSGPLRVEATARDAAGLTRSAGEPVDANGWTTITLDAAGTAAQVVDLALKDAASGEVLERVTDAAVVDIVPRSSLLYVHGSAAPLAQALARGGWSLETVPASRLDAYTDSLGGFQAVVLDDVAVSDAQPRFWAALAHAVNVRGLGLLALGGERSFARGGYHGSELERLLPVTAEPAALDSAAQVLFAVDKSGSMGSGSAGVDRFALARRAVIDTARGFGERDALGLLTFDVVPRVLMPLTPLAAARSTLERDWPVVPGGGTTLAPALEQAIGLLEHAGTGRRLLVLVTDGFVDDAPLAGLQERLAGAGIEIVALAVGPDADTRGLERAIGPRAGLVLRVGEAAELPQAMRSGVERRRARVHRGSSAVRQRAPLPFAPGAFADWPAVDAYAVTRARPQAQVQLESPLGEPLLASWTSGRGLVVAVPGGLGAWVPSWLGWREWPRLAGGLAEAVGAGSAGYLAAGAAVTGQAGRLRLEVDVAPGSSPDALPTITVDTPTARGLPLTAEWVAPGRLRATTADAGPGLYTFVLAGEHGTQRHLHLRRLAAESAVWGTNPALRDWAALGLVTLALPPPHRPDRALAPQGLPPDRALIGLGLALFLLGVLVDRVDRDSLRSKLARLKLPVRHR